MKTFYIKKIHENHPDLYLVDDKKKAFTFYKENALDCLYKEEANELLTRLNKELPGKYELEELVYEKPPLPLIGTFFIDSPNFDPQPYIISYFYTGDSEDIIYVQNNYQWGSVEKFYNQLERGDIKVIWKPSR